MFDFSLDKKANMALNVKKVKLDLHRYFGHELDLIIKNHPYLDYNHGSRLYNMIALQDSRTMEECFDADLLSKVSNALQNRRSSTSRQTELENNTTNNNRQEQNNLPDSENVSVVVSSSSSEESIVKSDQISAAKTDNVTQITPEITNDSVELNSQILTSANDEKKVENSSSQLPETSDKEDKSNEMKTLNSENTMETETTLKPTESKNDGQLNKNMLAFLCDLTKRDKVVYKMRHLTLTLYNSLNIFIAQI